MPPFQRRSTTCTRSTGACVTEFRTSPSMLAGLSSTASEGAGVCAKPAARNRAAATALLLRLSTRVLPGEQTDVFFDACRLLDFDLFPPFRQLEHLALVVVRVDAKRVHRREPVLSRPDVLEGIAAIRLGSRSITVARGEARRSPFSSRTCPRITAARRLTVTLTPAGASSTIEIQ